MRLKDKVAIVTGGGRGIGRAYALRLADEGAKVAIAEIALEHAQNVAAEIQAKGGEGLAIGTDVSDEASTVSMAKKTAEHFGRIDILVNNAAIMSALGVAKWDAWSKDDWHKAYLVNVVGPWLCAKAVTPYMITQGKGKIINISSSTFDIGYDQMLPYTCSKGAVVALTRGMATALGRYGINVNAIAPGYTLSEGGTEIGSRAPRMNEFVVRGRIMKRDQQPDDLVGTAVFLASDDSDFVTSQVILVDGSLY